MNYCVHCGAERVLATAKFCSECGQAFPHEQATEKVKARNRTGLPRKVGTSRGDVDDPPSLKHADDIDAALDYRLPRPTRPRKSNRSVYSSALPYSQAAKILLGALGLGVLSLVVMVVLTATGVIATSPQISASPATSAAPQSPLAAEASPDSTRAAQAQAVVDHLGAANSFVQAKNWPAALKEYDAALAIDPRNQDAATGREAMQTQLVREHMGAANTFLAAHNYEAALNEYNAVLDVDPSDLDARAGKARAQEALNPSSPTAVPVQSPADDATWIQAEVTKYSNQATDGFTFDGPNGHPPSSVIDISRSDLVVAFVFSGHDSAQNWDKQSAQARTSILSNMLADAKKHWPATSLTITVREVFDYAQPIVTGPCSYQSNVLSRGPGELGFYTFYNLGTVSSDAPEQATCLD